MRMEELAHNQYIKQTDSVEKYLLELVRTYFKAGNVADDNSREATINTAVERMHDELTLDGMGVLSITVNGEERIGAVSITLEDLNGEPRIDPKGSAFNVNFGTEKGTACEGNDPRLYDARYPLSHTHQTSDIIGLDGILSTLTGKVNRLNGLAHTHKNINILDMLVYTGEKTVIDLDVIDNMDEKISTIVNQIMSEITSFRADISQLITDTTDQIDDIERKIEDLRTVITQKNEEYYDKAVDYADTKYSGLKTEFENAIADFIEEEDMENILTVANQSISLAGTASVNIRDVLDFTGDQKERKATYLIPPITQQDIIDRGSSVLQSKIEFLIRYTDSSGKQVYSPLPYVTFKDGAMNGTLQASNDMNNIYITYTSKDGTVPTEIQNATFICNFYSRQDVTL